MKLIKNLTVLGLLSITFVGAQSAHAQITKKGDGYLFRIKWTPGQTIKYVMNMSMSGDAMPKPMNMNMSISQKVKKVAGTVATIEATTSGVPGQPKPQVQTMTIDNRGRATSGAAAGSQVAFPEGPVKIGQTWKGSLPGMQQGMAGDAVYKLLSVKTVGGKPVAEVGLSLNMKQGGAMSMTGSGTMLIFMADGSLSSMTMNTNMSMSQQGKTQKMKMGVTMRRG